MNGNQDEFSVMESSIRKEIDMLKMSISELEMTLEDLHSESPIRRHLAMRAYSNYLSEFKKGSLYSQAPLYERCKFDYPFVENKVSHEDLSKYRW